MTPLSIKPLNSKLTGKPLPGIYATIKADKTGWWVSFYDVNPNGTSMLQGHVEAFRAYTTFAKLKADLKKSPYHADYVLQVRK